MGIVLFAALLVLLRLGRAGRRGALVVAIALIAVWANVDTSFALGVALTIAVCADGALRDASHRSRYLVIALAALAVTLATPAGIGAWAGQGTTPLRQVSEWGVIDVRTPVGFVYATTLALVLASAILGRRGDASEVIVLVPVTLVSLTALRQAPLLAIAGAPLLAVRAEWVLNEIQGRWGTRGDPRPAGDALPSRRPTRSDGPARTIGVVGAVLLAAAAVFVTPTTLDEGAYPVAALASLPQGAGLLARYEWGGWLIWRAPATPVFVDGRLTPYVGGVLDDYRAILDARPGWQEVIARRGVRSLLVAPSDAVAVRARELRWTVVSSSASYVLLTVP
jgi:hypothetical protein